MPTGRQTVRARGRKPEGQPCAYLPVDVRSFRMGEGSGAPIWPLAAGQGAVCRVLSVPLDDGCSPIDRAVWFSTFILRLSGIEAQRQLLGLARRERVCHPDNGRMQVGNPENGWTVDKTGPIPGAGGHPPAPARPAPVFCLYGNRAWCHPFPAMSPAGGIQYPGRHVAGELRPSCVCMHGTHAEVVLAAGQPVIILTNSRIKKPKSEAGTGRLRAGVKEEGLGQRVSDASMDRISPA
ncbi:hypothetical protein VTI74DRAFT_129 [Chaetomium olivicolor]